MKPAIRPLLALGLLPLILGCSSAGVPAVRGEPAPDPAGLADELRSGSIPETPQQVNFAWTLEEGGSRARGRGVVRIEAPERIRLDLFGPRGETYLIAALVDSEYRMPTQVAAPVALPSPTLLWAAMGVFEPPPGAELSSANLDGESVEMRYTASDGDLYLFNFTARDPDQVRLVSVERAATRGVVETVTVRRNDGGAIERSDYRDWSAFRNLTLEVEAIREAASFPTSIWRPDVEIR